eukprot:356694-Chlamydomonas_euryale.AAC.1
MHCQCSRMPRKSTHAHAPPMQSDAAHIATCPCFAHACMHLSALMLACASHPTCSAVMHAGEQ